MLKLTAQISVELLTWLKLSIYISVVELVLSVQGVWLSLKWRVIYAVMWTWNYFLLQKVILEKYFRNHEFHGQKQKHKTSIQLRHSAVYNRTMFSFGDYRVFIFLHVLEHTACTLSNGSAFPVSLVAFLPLSTQIKLNKINPKPVPFVAGTRQHVGAVIQVKIQRRKHGELKSLWAFGLHIQRLGPGQVAPPWSREQKDLFMGLGPWINRVSAQQGGQPRLQWLCWAQGVPQPSGTPGSVCRCRFPISSALSSHPPGLGPGGRPILNVFFFEKKPHPSVLLASDKALENSEFHSVLKARDRKKKGMVLTEKHLRKGQRDLRMLLLPCSFSD